MSLPAANREIYDLLKDGVRVTMSGPDGEEELVEILRVIDWGSPSNNDFLAASQMWISGEMYLKRPDLIGFINGLPFLLMEFKRIDEPVYLRLHRQSPRLQRHHSRAVPVQCVDYPLQRFRE